MSTAWIRLGAAAFVSVVGVASTCFWYYGGGGAETTNDGKKPLAYLQASSNVVEGRQRKRVMWQPVGVGQPLYQGDAIRTARDADGRVQLVGANGIIEIEPDSLIVIEESKGQLAIDLVSGGLFVKDEGHGKAGGDGAKSKAPPLVLKVGKTTLKADGKAGALAMNLRVDKGGTPTVVVDKGAVQGVAANGKPAFKVESGSAGVLDGSGGVKSVAMIQVTTPPTNGSVDIGKGDRPVAFGWKPLDSGLSVFVELGTAPAQLARQGGGFPGASGVANVALRAGRFYFRLVAVDASGKTVQSSAVLRFDAVSIAPPELQTPVAGAAIALNEGRARVDLSWVAGPPFDAATVRVAATQDMSAPLLDRPAGAAGSVAFETTKIGTYYWQVTASGGGRRAASGVRSFSVRAGKPLAAPRLDAPADGAKFDVASLPSTGLLLTWAAEDLASGGYRLKVRPMRGGGGAVNEVVSRNRYSLADLPPGAYVWSVQALTTGGDPSPPSAERRFELRKRAALTWIEPTAERLFFTASEKRVRLRWRASQGVKQWRVTATEGGAVKTRKSERTQLDWPVERAGRYEFVVEGLDDDGQVVAQSPAKRVDAQPAPKLAAPRLLGLDASGGMKAPSGNVTLRWQAVKGASRYRLVIRAPSGGEKEHRATGATFKLDGLKPGTYRVRVEAVSKDGEGGDQAPELLVEVPAVSDLPPPVIKAIEIQ